MKKIIALLLSLLLGVGSLVGCSSNESETATSKSYTAESTPNGVSIDVRDRQVEVAISADNQIHIDYFETDKEYYDISVSDENVLTMVLVNDKEFTDYIGSKTSLDFRKISLQLPKSLIASLKLSTTNEDISVPELSVSGEITLSSVDGDIIFTKLDAAKTITLDAKNGNISGSIIGGYDDYAISCNIKKGKSNLPESKTGGEKTLEVSNNNGNIDIEFVSA